MVKLLSSSSFNLFYPILHHLKEFKHTPHRGSMLLMPRNISSLFNLLCCWGVLSSGVGEVFVLPSITDRTTWCSFSKVHATRRVVMMKLITHYIMPSKFYSLPVENWTCLASSSNFLLPYSFASRVLCSNNCSLINCVVVHAYFQVRCAKYVLSHPNRTSIKIDFEHTETFPATEIRLLSCSIR
jgi:hypothetical protein